MTPQTLAPAAGSLAIASLAFGGDNCALVDNGSFNNGLNGWVVDEVETTRGDGTAVADVSITEPRGPFSIMDQRVFSVDADATVTGTQLAGFGEALIDVRLSRTVQVQGPTLQLFIHGGGDFTWWGEPLIHWLIQVQIEDPDGAVHNAYTAEHIDDTDPAICDIGFSLGVFYNHPFNPTLTEIDLLKTAGVKRSATPSRSPCAIWSS